MPDKSANEESAVARLELARTALIEWMNQQGHDRCWYYPDVFDQLCQLLGVDRPKRPVLPPRREFERGCQRYQDAQYSDATLPDSEGCSRPRADGIATRTAS